MFELWKLTRTYSGLDGRIEDPFNLLRLEKLAQLVGRPWDKRTFQYVSVLIAGFLESQPKK